MMTPAEASGWPDSAGDPAGKSGRLLCQRPARQHGQRREGQTGEQKSENSQLTEQ